MPFVITLKIAVPSNTASTAPIKNGVHFPAGSVIEHILVHVPSGAQALAPVWFEQNGGKFLPTPVADSEAEIRLDDIAGQDVLAGPIGLNVEADIALAGYNEDTANPHTTRAILIGRYRGELTAEEASRYGV